MRKVLGAINVTLDSIFDHNSVSPDEEIHRHFADLLENAGVILYGRTTFQLMQYWQELAKNPSGEKSMDEFALVMDKTPKIVFSKNLDSTGWHSAQLADQPLDELVKDLKNQPGKDILVGSRSLIVQLLEHNLLDELQLCLHPVIAGGGQHLFENLSSRTAFNLIGTRSFKSGAIALNYQPVYS